MDINREILLESFRDETEDCLHLMRWQLLKLKAHPRDYELISMLSREARTLKGNASLLNFNVLTDCLQSLEEILDICSARSEAVPEELISLLLQSVHILQQMAKKIVSDDPALFPVRGQVFARLRQIATERGFTVAATNHEFRMRSESNALFTTPIGNS
jgi:chemotaxis protein histidine kinase CheA